MSKWLPFFLLCYSFLLADGALLKPIKYRPDDASALAQYQHHPNSHLKVYLPSIPYSYIMRLINGTLVRLNDSPHGWEYFLAYKHEKISPTAYDFWLREDVKFQDGSPFNADALIANFEAFMQGAFTYTNIHNVLERVEKRGPYKVRIHLKSPYGMLLNDLARIHLYTPSYLKQNPWSKRNVGAGIKSPGTYGSGPYILTSGFATGLKQSEKIILKANPYYFKKEQPYIETITIYTQLPIDDVVRMITEKEGELDIAVLPFDRKTEIVNSKHAKLVSTTSSYNFSIHMNLMNASSPLHTQAVRQALNQAIDQEKLIKYAYKNEGTISPFPLSANSYFARELSKHYILSPKAQFSQDELHALLGGLELKIVTQDRFLSLWKGIEYQLNNYGVKLDYDITTDETYVLNKLLSNRENHYDWDLLIWGNGDWYGHPWTSFFTLYTQNQWSSIDEDPELDEKIQEFFKIQSDDKDFALHVNSILEYAYEKAYMLSVPSPNVLLALNKEVVFTPSSVAIFRLWEAALTPFHWSIRGDMKLPKSRETYILPKRITHDE